MRFPCVWFTNQTTKKKSDSDRDRQFWNFNSNFMKIYVEVRLMIMF